MARKLTAVEIVDIAGQQGLTLAYGDLLLRPSEMAVNNSRWDGRMSLLTQLTPTMSLQFPLIAAPMDTVVSPAAACVIANAGGVAVMHRNFGLEELQGKTLAMWEQVRYVPIFMSVGVQNGGMEIAKALYAQGCRRLCVEVPNGWMQFVFTFIQELMQHCPEYELMAGNVADPDGVVAIARLPGVKTIRVGIGAGSACTTRLIAGVGVGQFTAIVEAVEALSHVGLLARERSDGGGVTVIADGGIREWGDLVKALAVADAVMIGGRIAGCDESPGDIIEIGGKSFKQFRGMSSLEASQGLRDTSRRAVVAEGVATTVPYRGSLQAILNEAECGLRSGMSYAGALALAELRKNARFVRITPAGRGESEPARF